METNNSLITYDTLEVNDVINEGKDEVDGNSADVEIKEVYFGEYLNHCDSIEDENTVLINRDNTPEEPASDNVLNVQSVDAMSALLSSHPEDIQISQIVEGGDVSLK